MEVIQLVKYLNWMNNLGGKSDEFDTADKRFLSLIYYRNPFKNIIWQRRVFLESKQNKINIKCSILSKVSTVWIRTPRTPLAGDGFKWRHLFMNTPNKRCFLVALPKYVEASWWNFNYKPLLIYYLNVI